MRNTSLGRHAKQAAGRWRPAAARAVKTGAAWAALTAAWALLLAVAVAFYTVAVAAVAAARIWHGLGVHGRFIAAMVAAPFTAVLASSAGLLPAGPVAILIAAGAGVAVFGAWLRIVTWRGQREWKQRRHPAVVHGGAAADSGATAAWVDEHERRIVMLERALLAIREGSGDGTPAEMRARRHLRAVGDDSGPLPRIS
jgi:hypothetical protein